MTQSNVKLEWLILADYVSVDSSGKQSIIGIFDTIFTAKVPAKHRELNLSTQLQGPANCPFNVEIDIVAPGGKVLATLNGSGKLGANGRIFLPLSMRDLPLPTYGSYSFDVRGNGKALGQRPFQVLKPPATLTAIN